MMSLGINFIYGIMKVINWAMGEYYMIGSYILYLLITYFMGVKYWYFAVLLGAVAVFFLGAFVQFILIKPMFVGAIGERGEYGTIVTIATAIFLRNLAIVIGGPYIYTPPDYAGPTQIGPLPISGNTLVALLGALVLLASFYFLIKRTWVGRALQGVAQNRNGIQTSGVDILKFDMLAFGIGTSLAAAAGALLAPVYLVYPTCGLVSTVRGFEIIVIAGLGSIWGVLVAGLALGIMESLGAVFISPSFLDIYGFILLVIVLSIKPYGLFGKEERIA
jgi:branched-chain amino acid transport system permease protein